MKKFLVVLLVLCSFAGVAFAASLDEIKAKGVLKVATANFDMPPFETTKDGAVVGLDIDLAQAIADKIGVKLEIVRLPWENGIDLSWNKDYKWDQFDMAASSITMKEARSEVCDFSEWYYTTGQMILVKKDSPIKSKDDAVGKNCAVLANSVGVEAAEKALKGVVVPQPDFAASLKALDDGAVDVVVFDGPTVLDAAKANPDKYVALEDLLTRERYGLALPKGQDTLKALVDEVVTSQREELNKKWFQ